MTGLTLLCPRRLLRAAVFVVVLFGCWFCCGSASALSVREYSQEELLANSDLIFAGTVLTAKSDWINTNQTMIGTTYTVRVDERVDDAVAGEAPLGETTQLYFLGGHVGDCTINIPGVPHFQPGYRALFLIDRENAGGLSPVVGINQGLYTITTNAANEQEAAPYSEAGCCRAAAKASGVASQVGVPLESLISRIKRDLPATRSNPDLKIKRNYVPAIEPAEVTIAELSVAPGNEDPEAAPLEPYQATTDLPFRAGENQPVRNPADFSSRTIKAPEAIAMPAAAVGQTPIDGDGTRYAWLPWSTGYVRPGPISFNISPRALAAHQEQGITALHRWNQYANAFAYTQATQPWGPRNRRSEIVFDTVANIRALYQYDASNIYGVMMPYATGGKVTETDVVIPIDSVNWALDFDTSWNSIWSGGQFRPFMLSTLLHEVGHAFGREHTFKESGVDWLSTMDYGPIWFRSLRHIVYRDDAESLRARYPARNIADAGFFLYHADPAISGDSKYKLSAVSGNNVSAGASIVIDKCIVENIGNQPMSDLRIQWQLREVGGGGVYNATYHLLHGTLAKNAFWPLQNMEITVPTSAPTGTYELLGRLEWKAAGQGDDVAYNNVSTVPSRIAVTNTLPDLVDGGDALRACSPAETFPGSAVSVQCAISNAGQSASGNFKVGFYAHSTTAPAVGYMLGVSSVAGIAAGESATCSFEGRFPTHGLPGEYVVTWDIDYESAVAEVNEGNNTWSEAGYLLEIMPRPDLDLRFDNIYSTMKVKGKSGQITGDVIVVNVGTRSAPACTMGVYCLDYAQGSLVRLQEMEIPELGSAEYVNLQPGTTLLQAKNGKQAKKAKRKKLKFKFAKDFSPANKHLALIIDDTHQVTEASEENNLFTTPVSTNKKK